MDLLNENKLKENKYSVHVNMGRKVGDITLKVNAKDEKEARALIAKGLKNPKDIKKVVKEGILNEARQVTKTRFGAVTVSISEEGGAPGYNPTLLVDVALDKKPLADINVTGDPRDNPYEAEVKVFPGKKKLKIRT